MKKNTLIVGGSSGIGLALAKDLSEDNQVFVASRSNDSLSGLSVTHIPYDVETDALLDTSLLPEAINGLVYCPGTINLRPFKGLKPEVFQQDFSINVCLLYTSPSPRD